MKNTILFKKTKVDGWNVEDRWSFGRAIDNPEKLYARHYITNKKGTYQRQLGQKWFNTAEEGNEFYMKLRKEGYEIQ